MEEKLNIGNGIVAPLSYETIMEADEGSRRMMEAVMKGELDPNLPDEELVEKAIKYYLPESENPEE